MACSEKRALKERSRTIVFCDQSGFYLLPMVVRTYAPVGETPILHEHLTRSPLGDEWHNSEGKLYMLEHDRAFKGRRGAFPGAPHAPNPRQAVGDLGRLCHPSLSGSEGVS